MTEHAMDAKDRADGWESDRRERLLRKLQAIALARARERVLEQRRELSQDADALPRGRPAEATRSPARGDLADEWSFEEQEPHDWIEAEQQAQRWLGIEGGGRGPGV